LARIAAAQAAANSLMSFNLETAMMNSRCYRTTGLAIVICQLISGCALESKLYSPEDAKITANVKALLDQHPSLDINSIYVTIHNHVVYLSGLVGSGLAGADAEEIARQAPGVVRVLNNVVQNN
jgi:osmotically-inducible protein OsmY